MAGFPSTEENEMDLFTFLAKQAVPTNDERKVTSACGKRILMNSPMENISHLSQHTYEEADARLRLHLQQMLLLLDTRE